MLQYRFYLGIFETFFKSTMKKMDFFVILLIEIPAPLCFSTENELLIHVYFLDKPCWMPVSSTNTSSSS